MSWHNDCIGYQEKCLDIELFCLPVNAVLGSHSHCPYCENVLMLNNLRSRDYCTDFSLCCLHHKHAIHIMSSPYRLWLLCCWLCKCWLWLSRSHAFGVKFGLKAQTPKLEQSWNTKPTSCRMQHVKEMAAITVLVQWCIDSGRNVQDNKCGWLVVQALQKASSGQQQIIKVFWIPSVAIALGTLNITLIPNCPCSEIPLLSACNDCFLVAWSLHQECPCINCPYKEE